MICSSLAIAGSYQGPTWSSTGFTPCHLCIWGARAEDLTPYAEEAGMVMVPTRYKVNCCGWRSIHGGDAYLAASSLRARADFELVAHGQSAMSTKELLCRLVRHLSMRQRCRQVMLWCLLALDLLTEMRAHVDAHLRDAMENAEVSCTEQQSKSRC